MKNRLIAFALLGAIVVGCCGFLGCASTPQATVYAGQKAENFGLVWAKWYIVTLPDCATAPAGTVLCHEHTIVQKMGVIVDRVDDARTKAQALVRTPGFDPASAAGLEATATAALSELLQLIVQIETANPALAKAGPKQTTTAMVPTLTSTPAHS